MEQWKHHAEKHKRKINMYCPDGYSSREKHVGSLESFHSVATS